MEGPSAGKDWRRDRLNVPCASCGKKREDSELLEHLQCQTQNFRYHYCYHHHIIVIYHLQLLLLLLLLLSQS